MVHLRPRSFWRLLWEPCFSVTFSAASVCALPAFAAALSFAAAVATGGGFRYFWRGVRLLFSSPLHFAQTRYSHRRSVSLAGLSGPFRASPSMHSSCLAWAHAAPHLRHSYFWLSFALWWWWSWCFFSFFAVSLVFFHW